MLSKFTQCYKFGNFELLVEQIICRLKYAALPEIAAPLAVVTTLFPQAVEHTRGFLIEIVE